MREISRVVKRTPNTIFHWEEGFSVPSVESLVLWANALGYDIGIVERGYKWTPQIRF